MMAAMPADAMGGMDADMVAAVPPGVMDAAGAVDSGNMADPAVTAADTAANDDPMAGLADFAAANPTGGDVANDDPMAGLADFAAANPTGGEASVMDTPIATDAPAPAEAAPSIDDALGAAMDAGEIGGASVADAAVPDAGVPADAGIADAPEAAEPAEPTAAPEPDIV
jgi:hypothetical protein